MIANLAFALTSRYYRNQQDVQIFPRMIRKHRRDNAVYNSNNTVIRFKPIILLSTLCLFTLAIFSSNIVVKIPPVQASSYTINIQNFNFNPQNLTIQSGDVITWTNNDPVIYTLWFTNSTDGSTYLFSPPINPGTSWTYTFKNIINLKYYDFDRLQVTGQLNIVRPLNSYFTPESSTSLTVTFLPVVSGGTRPYTYSWNFGDGTSSTSSAPTHTYEAFTSYNVTLTITDSSSPNKLTSTQSQFLTIFTPGVGGGGGCKCLNL